jgi:hypothetical protein
MHVRFRVPKCKCRDTCVHLISHKIRWVLHTYKCYTNILELFKLINFIVSNNSHENMYQGENNYMYMYIQVYEILHTCNCISGFKLKIKKSTPVHLFDRDEFQRRSQANLCHSRYVQTSTRTTDTL